MEIKVHEKHHCKRFKFVEILNSYVLKFPRWSKFPFGMYVKAIFERIFLFDMSSFSLVVEPLQF